MPDETRMIRFSPSSQSQLYDEDLEQMQKDMEAKKQPTEPAGAREKIEEKLGLVNRLLDECKNHNSDYYVCYLRAHKLLSDCLSATDAETVARNAEIDGIVALLNKAIRRDPWDIEDTLMRAAIDRLRAMKGGEL